MAEGKLRSGVVLTEIKGVFLLVSDKEARKHCAYIRELNEIGAFICRRLVEGCRPAEIPALLRLEYDIPDDCDPGADTEAFLRELRDNGYLTEEADHEV